MHDERMHAADPETDGLRSRTARVLRIAGRLLLPSPCAVCGSHDGALCAACAAAIDDRPHRRDLGPLTVHSAWRFDEHAAPAIRALKGEGRTELAAPLGRALAAALRAAAAGAGPVVAVPVPTNALAYRRRGFHVVEGLLRHARAEPVRALRTGRMMLDQRGLSRTEREQNTADAFVPTHCAKGLLTRVVLVDDVVTTGATLRAAAAALSGAGIDVAGAATLAWTPRGKSVDADP